MSESTTVSGLLDLSGRSEATQGARPASKSLHHLLTAAKAVLLGAGAIMAGVLIFAVANYSKIQESHANFERAEAAAIAAENRTFCENVGLGDGTDQHSACMRDLDTIRARHERRILAASQGLL
jgi:hypothetical protein